MTKHTETLPPLPSGSIDFNKVHSAAKQGHSDPFKGAVTHQRGETDTAGADEGVADTETAGSRTHKPARRGRPAKPAPEPAATVTEATTVTRDEPGEE